MKGKNRRKAIICSLAIIASTVGATAQGFSGLGAKLGYNSSGFVGADIPGKGVSSKSGLALGGFVTFEFDKTFSLQQEVLFTLKGAKVNTIADLYLTNFFLYLELPMLAKIAVSPDHRLRPTVYVGPAAALLIMAFNDRYFLYDIRDVDLGAVLGVSIDVWKITLDLRLTRGLLNFDQSADGIDLKNQTISVMIGYAF